MASSSSIICIFLIIFIISKSSTSEEEFQWKIHRLMRKDGWTVVSERLDNPILAYAMCKNERLTNKKRECAILLQKDIHNNTTKPTKCSFTLDYASHGIIRVENFGNDRVIFVWTHEAMKNRTLHWTYRMAVVQVSNCHVVNTGFIVSTKTSEQWGERMWHLFHITILAYDDTFDVVVQRAKACGNATDEKHCLYTFDGEGKKIGGPVTIFTPRGDKQLYHFRQISRKSSAKGYLVTDGHKTMHVSILKLTGNADGEVNTTELWKYPLNPPGYASTASYTCNNQKIGVCTCQMQNDKLYCSCMQSEEDGTSKRQIKFSLNKKTDATVDAIFMHNLRGGGFFLTPFYTDEGRFFYATSKVNADGRIVGEPYNIGEHERSCYPEFGHTRFEEQDDGQYCITLACVMRNKTECIMKTLSRCYPSRFVEWRLIGKDGRFEL